MPARARKIGNLEKKLKKLAPPQNRFDLDAPPAGRTGATLTEEHLQELLLEGSEQHEDMIQKKIPRNLRATMSSRDILQEVWIAAFRGVSAFRPDGPDGFERWLSTITRRKVVDAIKAAKRARRVGEGERVVRNRERLSRLEFIGSLTSSIRTPSRVMAAKESVEAVQIAICSLPDDYREIVTLYYLEGMTSPQIAEKTNRSRGAVTGIISRALRLLRQRLGPKGRYFSDVDDEAITPLRRSVPCDQREPSSEQGRRIVREEPE